MRSKSVCLLAVVMLAAGLLLGLPATAVAEGGFMPPGDFVPPFVPPENGFMPPEDGFIPPEDGFTPPEDGFVPPEDGFIPPEDGFMPPEDGFVPPEDGFIPPEDGFVPPEDGFMPPEDGFIPPEDDAMWPGEAPPGWVGPWPPDIPEWDEEPEGPPPGWIGPWPPEPVDSDWPGPDVQPWFPEGVDDSTQQAIEEKEREIDNLLNGRMPFELTPEELERLEQLESELDSLWGSVVPVPVPDEPGMPGFPEEGYPAPGEFEGPVYPEYMNPADKARLMAIEEELNDLLAREQYLTEEEQARVELLEAQMEEIWNNFEEQFNDATGGLPGDEPEMFMLPCMDPVSAARLAEIEEELGSLLARSFLTEEDKLRIRELEQERERIFEENEVQLGIWDDLDLTWDEQQEVARLEAEIERILAVAEARGELTPEEQAKIEQYQRQIDGILESTGKFVKWEPPGVDEFMAGFQGMGLTPEEEQKIRDYYSRILDMERKGIYSEADKLKVDRLWESIDDILIRHTDIVREPETLAPPSFEEFLEGLPFEIDPAAIAQLREDYNKAVSCEMQGDWRQAEQFWNKVDAVLNEHFNERGFVVNVDMFGENKERFIRLQEEVEDLYRELARAAGEDRARIKQEIEKRERELKEIMRDYAPPAGDAVQFEDTVEEQLQALYEQLNAIPEDERFDPNNKQVKDLLDQIQKLLGL